MHAIMHASVPARLVPIHHDQHLSSVVLAVHRRDQTASHGELVKPKWRDVAAASRSDDGVVRGRRRVA